MVNLHMKRFPGRTMTTKLLRKHNILVFNENQITDLLNFIKNNLFK